MKTVSLIINHINKEQFSLFHIFMGAFVYAAISSGDYIAAGITFILGSCAWSLMTKSKSN